MSQKKRGLSRGLEALLAGTGLNLPIQPGTNPSLAIDQPLVTNLHLEQLVPGKFQPREDLDPTELQALVESIKSQGILQPIIARKLTNDSYEIIAGERRWRAATLANLTTVPVILKEINDQAALTIALIENIQRENLNPLEEARALQRLIQEFTLTHNEIAAAIGRSRTMVTNLLRILQLPHAIKEMLARKQLELGHAKVLLSAPKEFQQKLAHQISTEQLSVRATEQLLKKYTKPAELKTLGNPKLDHLDPDLKYLQQKICNSLGAKVKIFLGKNNKGKLIIEYHNLTELEGILERMQITEAC